MTESERQEQRAIAIHLLRSGCRAEEVAQQLNCSVRWVYKWQARFRQEEWGGLHSRSRAPKKHGRDLPRELQSMIKQVRSELEAEAAEGKGLGYIGSQTVQGRLRQRKVKPLPSTATIERVLRAAGMTKSHQSKAREEVIYPHLQPSQPHQLVQVDIVPHYLRGGEAVACFNAIDVVSRYPTGQAFGQRRAQEAVDFLIHTWQTIGLPVYTQVDNEGCFSGGFTHPAVLGQVIRLALWVGTQLVFSPVYHPESNGTVERFHQEYDRFVWKQHQLSDCQQVNQVSSRFFQQYRQDHYHSALKGQTPVQLHFQSPPRYLPTSFTRSDKKLPLTVGQVHFLRRVQAAGTISLLNQAWTVPQTQPDTGVWATLEFTLAGAFLRIYDQAPDAQTRCCLVTYPFPLKEPVLPKQPLLLSTQNPSVLPNSTNPGFKAEPPKSQRNSISKLVYRAAKATISFFTAMF